MIVDRGMFNIQIDDIRAIADNIVVKNVVVHVEYEANEITEKSIEKVIQVIQRFEPVGIACRDLKECRQHHQERCEYGFERHK